MISRRAFLSTLAALPIVGKLIPQTIEAICHECGELRSNWRHGGIGGSGTHTYRAFDPWEPMTLDGKPIYTHVDATGKAFHDGSYFLSFPNSPSWIYRDGKWYQTL